jgi:hypothetical protein
MTAGEAKVIKMLKALMGITFRVLSGLREARLVQSQGKRGRRCGRA